MPPERIPQEVPPLAAQAKPRFPKDGQRNRLRNAEVVSINPLEGMVWRGPDYPLLESGNYVVRAVKVQGPEWVRSFCRWSLRIEFALTTEPGFISAFFNFGNDKTAKSIGRQSRYFKAWTVANGELPKRGELMSPDVFLNGQFFEVLVEKCDKDSAGNPKPEEEVYSRVTKIVRAWTE